MAQNDNDDPQRSDETRTESSSSAHAQRTASQIAEKSDRLKDKIQEPDTEPDVNRRWFPYIYFAIGLNFFLLISIFYVIYDARYFATNRSRYLGYAWLIFFLPFIVTTFVLFSPIPQRLNATRTAFVERKSSLQLKKFVNVFNAVVTFILAVAYLYNSAIPRYNSPKLSQSTESQNIFPIPSVAFAVFHETVDANNHTIPYAVNYTTDSSGRFMRASIDDGFGEDPYPPDSFSKFLVDSNVTIMQVNSSKLARSIQNPFGTQVIFGANFTYNSSLRTRSALRVGMFVFDSRVEILDVLRCGLIRTSYIDPFAVSYFGISVENIYDQHDVLTPPEDYEPDCAPWYRQQLTRTDPYYERFDYFLTSSVPSFNVTLSECDVEINPNATCEMRIVLFLGNSFVVTQESVTGISILDIWLNLGAVVGAVQFFGWFLLIAVGG